MKRRKQPPFDSNQPASSSGFSKTWGSVAAPLDPGGVRANAAVQGAEAAAPATRESDQVVHPWQQEQTARSWEDEMLDLYGDEVTPPEPNPQSEERPANPPPEPEAEDEAEVEAEVALTESSLPAETVNDSMADRAEQPTELDAIGGQPGGTQTPDEHPQPEGRPQLRHVQGTPMPVVTPTKKWWSGLTRAWRHQKRLNQSFEAEKQARYEEALAHEEVALKRANRGRPIPDQPRKPGRIWSKIWHASPFTRKFMVTSLCLFVLAVSLLLPPFTLTRAEFRGLRHLKGEQLWHLSGLSFDQHLIKGLGGSLEDWLRLQYGRAQEQIQTALPMIKTVRIRPRLPGRVVFEVEERLAVAYIRSGQDYLVLDGEGFVLSIQSEPPEGLPWIEGIEPQRARVGEPLAAPFRRRLASSLQIMATLLEADEAQADDWNFLGRVESILPLDADNHFLTLRWADKTLVLAVGALAEQREALFWARALLKRGLVIDQSEGLLDLRGKQRLWRPLDQFKVTLEHLKTGAAERMPTNESTAEPEIASTADEQTTEGPAVSPAQSPEPTDLLKQGLPDTFSDRPTPSATKVLAKPDRRTQVPLPANPLGHPTPLRGGQAQDVLNP